MSNYYYYVVAVNSKGVGERTGGRTEAHGMEVAQPGPGPGGTESPGAFAAAHRRRARPGHAGGIGGGALDGAGRRQVAVIRQLGL